VREERGVSVVRGEKESGSGVWRGKMGNGIRYKKIQKIILRMI